MKPVFYLFALVPTILSAETFTLDTDVSAVTVYPDSALITRRAEFDVPAGAHRLILLGTPENDDLGHQIATMQFRADGLTQTALISRFEDVPWRDYVGDAVKQVEDRIKDIETRIQSVQDQAETARLKAQAADHTITFLSNLGRNVGLAGSDPENLRNIARMVGNEALEAENTALAAELEARETETQLTELETELDAARADLVALWPEANERILIAVDVVAEEDTEGTLSLSYLSYETATWQPAYVFDLKTGSVPEVQISRSVLVGQMTGENWNDITLSVSTLQPNDQSAASRIRDKRRSIREKPKALEEPVAEAPVFEVTQRWRPSAASIQGTGTTYTLPVPISISSGYGAAELELDSMSQPAEVFALANPSRDTTAYRTARFTNPYSQNLFSSDYARWQVDGVLVAVDSSPDIGPGEEVELGFGPLYALTLRRQVLGRRSGDVGLIARSNERAERAQIRVENLSDETWPLRLLDSVPYSEQDDLKIEWTATPKPTDENVDNRRGILAWEMELAPGQTETVEIETKLSWPEGMVLK
ncbi:DUF4139 domain-containing protein [Ruegeria sp. HU-ET01832]|uniref:DUF4139 domain-containing protein n=1 Tax=Ruegeria sp. HU-ET01832 TaxID=3135906 RepID=UPI003341E273